LEWVKNNITLITRVATDPIEHLPEWEAADEPWQFLAACEEYYHCVVVADRQFTGLMVATDATCSGLQILAGLARDRTTAQLVNVLPSDRPQDAYKVVAEAARPDCPERLQPFMDRKKTKRVVMTIPYNAKPLSNRDYIRKAFDDEGMKLTKEELTQVVKAVRDTMDRIVPGPMAVMKWIENEVGAVIKRGASHLEWVTPSGFVVHQKINKRHIEQLSLQLMGRVRMNVANGDTDEVDALKHKSATAPNLIHSLDASLLHLSVLRFNAPIALIHDSVLCRATDMGQLSAVVRDVYMHLFAEHDYLRDWGKQIGAETDPPIIGDLEPETVIDSTYFFC
jgi:DNA-directed RNA polymerase